MTNADEASYSAMSSLDDTVARLYAVARAFGTSSEDLAAGVERWRHLLAQSRLVEDGRP